MSRRRFFVPSELIGDGSVELPPDQSHHLRNVLRIQSGERVEVLDGQGNAYTGVVEIDGASARIGSLQVLPHQVAQTLPVSLALPVIKPQRLEWILQKGTELGVDEFELLKTRLCDVYGHERVAGRLDRWTRIVQEACKQSGRRTAPRIGPLTDFASFITRAACPGAAGFLLHPHAEIWDGMIPKCDRILLCVGPEGGWAPEETEAAAQAGWVIVSLGSRTLRTETAALAALAVFKFQLSIHDRLS
jgi:16S rRNA (uracil1498-N3)-methyltransferase